MTAAELKEKLVRADGFSKGFFEGYAACARDVAEALQKEEDAKKLEEKNGGA